MCIEGGSACGYTTLGALAFIDVFKAGCSLYRVGDLTVLAEDTHQFESCYLDGLIGPHSQEAEDYEEYGSSIVNCQCPCEKIQFTEKTSISSNEER